MVVIIQLPLALNYDCMLQFVGALEESRALYTIHAGVEIMKIKENRGSFISQAMVLMVAGIISRILGFLYRLPLTTMLGDVGIGIYGAGYNFYMFLLIMSSAGLPAAISKMVSERTAQKRYADAHNVFRVALLFAVISGSIGSLILFVFAKPLSVLVNIPESAYSIIALSPTLLIVAVMSVYRGYFQGLGTTVPTAISQVIEQIFNAFFTVYLAYIFLGRGLPFASAGGTAATGIGAVAGLIFIVACYAVVRKDIHGRVTRSRQLNGKLEARSGIAVVLIKTAFPIIIGTAILSITNIADAGMVTSILIASGIGETRAKGLYGQLTGKYVTLTTLPVSFATALATAAIPAIAAAMQDNNPDNVKRKVDLALRTTMLIAFPCAVGIGVLGDQILSLLWPTVDGGGMLLRAGSMSIVFLSLAQICTGALQGINKVYVPVIAAGIGATVKIALNYLLIPIPSINVVGAVLSTNACYLVAGTINFFFLVKFSKIVPDYLNIFVKPLISSAAMGMACYSSYHLTYMYGLSHNLSTLFAIFIAVIVYFMFMLYLCGIKREDVLIMPAGEKILTALERLGFM